MHSVQVAAAVVVVVAAEAAAAAAVAGAVAAVDLVAALETGSAQQPRAVTTTLPGAVTATDATNQSLRVLAETRKMVVSKQNTPRKQPLVVLHLNYLILVIICLQFYGISLLRQF